MANPVGRPQIYTDVAEVERLIAEYFDTCDAHTVKVFDKKRGEVVELDEPEPYTMSGLAYYLKIDRDTLLNYSKKEKFFGTIKRARDKVHMDVERRLMSGAGVGAIFSLKNNFDWKDRREVDGEVKHTYEELDDEQLEAAIKAREDRTTGTA